MTATKKRSKKTGGWGGSRPGAGRPAGTGTGPGEDARVNRVVAMVSNRELKVLKRLARKANLPLGTQAYRIIRRTLQRAS